MRAISLQSGSNGNCVYVEADGVRLLVDAGISGRQAELRLAAGGRSIVGVDALLISHGHIDHVRCMGIFQRKFGLAIHASPRVLATARAACNQGALGTVRCFQPGGEIRFGHVRVQTVPTPHDSEQAVAFVIDDGRRRLGVLTDLGHVFDGLHDVIASLDAVFLESNYDEQMLADGPYPAWLKQRVRGPAGHISNVEAADLLKHAATRRMKWACLAHLSQTNNSPDLALRTHREILGDRLPLHVATRYGPSAVLEL